MALQLFRAVVNMVDLSKKYHWSIKQQMIKWGVPFLEEGSSATASADRKLE